MSVEQRLPRDIKEIALQERTTKRVISPGAEKWLDKVIPVLDHGFVRLVDYAGNDQSIEDAARVSYGEGTRPVNVTRGLIRYLRRHYHTTPFEMVEFKFHVRLPFFVARQWIRHRTANVNEYSARYSIIRDEFYVPDPDAVASQSVSNRQGRGEVVTPEQAEKVRQILTKGAASSYKNYIFMLNDDGKGKAVDPERPMIARELARVNLPLNFYTEWYWKIDLHNLFHFLRLRLDTHAQYEIRVYAEAIAKIVRDSVPLAWEAFEDYELYSLRLSSPEIFVLANLAKAKGVSFTRKEVLEVADSLGFDSTRERQEFLDNLRALGLMRERRR